MLSQFSIKDILWLTTLIGICAGWCLDHRAATVREEADWDALSRIDTTMQVQTHYLKDFQQKLDELQNGSFTPKEEKSKQTGNER